jgi:hypothetical protein
MTIIIKGMNMFKNRKEIKANPFFERLKYIITVGIILSTSIIGTNVARASGNSAGADAVDRTEYVIIDNGVRRTLDSQDAYDEALNACGPRCIIGPPTTSILEGGDGSGPSDDDGNDATLTTRTIFTRGVLARGVLVAPNPNDNQERNVSNKNNKEDRQDKNNFLFLGQLADATAIEVSKTTFTFILDASCTGQ